MNQNIFIAVQPSGTKYAWGEVVNPIYDEKQIDLCPLCKNYVSGMKWIEEKIIELRGRKNIPDFLYSYGTPLPFVISEKALTVLKENGIKGIIETEMIDKVITKKEPVDFTFYTMELERCEMPIDYVRSKILFGKPHSELKCKLCNPFGRTKNFIFELCFDVKATADADIFHIYEMGSTIFLSERFIKICQENQLTGLFYNTITDYSTIPAFFSEETRAKMLKEIEDQKIELQ